MMLTLEQVADIVYDVLDRPETQRYSRYPLRTVDTIELIRETYREHMLLPELPISSIVYRRITGCVTPEEAAFWEPYLTHRSTR